MQSFWNFAPSRAVSLPCSVQNFKLQAIAKSVIDKRDFTRFEFKMRFWRISYITQCPCCMINMRFLIVEARLSFLRNDKILCGEMNSVFWIRLQLASSGPVFFILLGKSSDYAQPITGQVTEVTWPVIGRAQPELTPSKWQKMDPDVFTSGDESCNHHSLH